MKGKLQFPLSLFLLLSVLMVCALTSCDNDDDYYYPSVKLEFLTAQADANGSLKSVLTDEGETFAVLEDASDMHIAADTSVRIVSNYGTTVTNGTSGVILYASLAAISPMPKPASEFKDGVKRDPADVTSIWMGLDYLNMILDIKAQNGKHSFHFVEEEAGTDAESGHRFVHLLLYHDSNEDVQAYSQRAYLSVPLRQYVTEGIDKVTVRFSLITYSGEEKSYEFEYNPE